MKKINAILFYIMTALILLAVPAFADNTYNVGIVNDYDTPEYDINSYAVSCLKNLFIHTDNISLKFDEQKTGTAVEMLGNGSFSFLTMVTPDSSLSDRVDLTDKPIATGFLSLFVNNEKDLYFNGYSDFKNIKVAMTHNSYFEGILSDFASENGFTYTPVYFENGGQMKQALLDGSADAMLLPASSSPENMRLIAKCGSFNYYCAVRKGDSSTLSMLNGLFDDTEEDYPFYLSQWYTSSFALPYNNMSAMTKEDYYAVKDKRKLRVYVPDNYPMVFYNGTNGKYEGIYIEILEKIAAHSGLELEYIANDLKNSDRLRQDMTLGRADAVLTVSGSTQGIIEATDPYTFLTFYPVGKNDIDAEGAFNVGITEDNAWITSFIRENYPDWSVNTYGSINSLLSAAEHGHIDAALVSSPELQTKTSLIAHPDLSIRQGFELTIPVSLGISKITCGSQFVSMFNRLIHSTSVENEVLESKVYTLSHTYIPNFRDMIYANRVWVIIILTIVLIILLLLYLRVRHFRRLARIDMLTRVYNAGYFIKTADKHLNKNYGKKYLLASIDAINFKLVNDRFGMTIGDQTLKAIAAEIGKLFRDKGIYGRLEGDHFIVITEDTPEHRRLLGELENMDIRIHDSTNYPVHIKTGICPIIRYSADTPLSIYIDRANIAKENVEAVGKNYLSYFTDKMYSKLEIENELEVDMTTSLERGEFIAYYQPKYDLITNQIVGAEALVRWNHKVKGLISPGIFVPLFEKNGFINKVDFCVYEQVMRVLKKRLMNNLPVVTVSINVSRCHLSDADFADRFDELVSRYKIPKEYIDMEITESIFSEGDNSANELVYELKRRGFSVSMDDFGSGYSSLNLLRIMPIDTLKIDKVFIEDIETSERSLNIIEEIINMARRIKVTTICEGIETEKQRDILRRAGCDMAQGYYYSKPLTEADFETLLDKTN